MKLHNLIAPAIRLAIVVLLAAAGVVYWQRLHRFPWMLSLFGSGLLYLVWSDMRARANDQTAEGEEEEGIADRPLP